MRSTLRRRRTQEPGWYVRLDHHEQTEPGDWHTETDYRGPFDTHEQAQAYADTHTATLGNNPDLTVTSDIVATLPRSARWTPRSTGWCGTCNPALLTEREN